MNISINMLMKIALVLVTVLIVSAVFMTLLQDGGDTIGEQETQNTNNLDCVMNNKDDALEECRDPTSLKIDERGVRFEA